MKKNYVPYGSDVSAGQFNCVDCGFVISMQSGSSLPPCPMYRKKSHPLKGWAVLSGQGDATNDPYP